MEAQPQVWPRPCDHSRTAQSIAPPPQPMGPDQGIHSAAPRCNHSLQMTSMGLRIMKGEWLTGRALRRIRWEITDASGEWRTVFQWRSPAGSVGNLFRSRSRASFKFQFAARSIASSFAGTCPRGTRGRKNVVTLGMCCRHLPWIGSFGEGRRARRNYSPRILCCCPVLRRQILCLRRRDVGEKPRRHRG